MATLLLMVIFIAFIGLGIPDSLLGTAWPSIYQTFNVPVSFAAFISCTVTIGTILSSLFSSRIINKFGTKYVVLISTALTVVGLFGFYLSRHFILLVVSAIPLGIGAGSIDSALNNYIAINYKPIHMNFLHCFYGIGVSLSPYLMAFALQTDNNYRRGYLYAFFIQLTITIILLISLPLWKRKEESQIEEYEPINIPLIKMIKTPLILCVGLMFFLYCGIEMSTGNWSASYLVNYKGFSKDAAARFAGLFYVGLASGRAIAGIISGKLTKFKLIFPCEVIILIGILLLVIPINNISIAVSLFLIGFGCGPIFPAMSAMTPDHYGYSYSQSIMGFQMALSYTAALTISPLLGILANALGFIIEPYYILVVTALTIIVTVIVFILKKKPHSLNV